MTYLFININQYFVTHPCGIIRKVEWTLKTLYWRCNENNLTSWISYTDSTDRRLFECLDRELFLWCEALHWFGVSDDFKVIQPNSMVTFVVGVNQEVGVLVLFVVLYYTLEESAFRLTNVVRVALWVRAFCMVNDVVLVFFFRLIFDFEFFLN